MVGNTVLNEMKWEDIQVVKRTSHDFLSSYKKMIVSSPYLLYLKLKKMESGVWILLSVSEILYKEMHSKYRMSGLLPQLLRQPPRELVLWMLRKFT